MELKRHKEDLNEDYVVFEMEKLRSNWEIYDQRAIKERIKLLELCR